VRRRNAPAVGGWKPLTRSNQSAIWRRVAKQRKEAGDEEGARIALEVARRFTGNRNAGYEGEE